MKMKSLTISGVFLIAGVFVLGLAACSSVNNASASQGDAYSGQGKGRSKDLPAVTEEVPGGEPYRSGGNGTGQGAGNKGSSQDKLSADGNGRNRVNPDAQDVALSEETFESRGNGNGGGRRDGQNFNSQSQSQDQTGGRGKGQRGGTGKGNGNGFGGQNASQNQISAEEIEGLMRAIEEELGAQALYQSVIDTFGDVEPFRKIVQAEAQHASALINQSEKYGLTVPEFQDSENLATFETLSEACQAGAQAEIADAALYDELMQFTTNNALLRVYTNLKNASLNNHLPAFEACQ